MSIADKLTRLSTAHDAISAAITTMGGTVTSGDGFEDFATDIATIPQSGGGSALDDYISGAQTAITSNVASIAGNVFNGNLVITSASFPLATGSGEGSFRGCTALTSFSAPELTSVNTDFLRDCTSLTSLTIPKVSGVGNSAFQGCTSLTTLDLPLCTSYLPYYSVAGCTSLTNVNIPNVITINESAFSYSGMTFIDLPRVGTIARNAFFGCANLTAIILRRTNVITLNDINALRSTAFRNGTGGTVYVPQALISSYQSATNWSALESTTFAAIEGSIYE